MQKSEKDKTTAKGCADQVNDPYKVLGVSRDATDEEIKKAYRELAKKYHPDNYRDSQLAELAEEKMKEINEAYDTIQRQRQGKSTGSGSGYQSGTSSYPAIRRMINEGRYAEAELNLDAVSQNSRNAEWHYLKAIILLRRGWMYDALNHVDIACSMDPENEEYKQLKLNLTRNANAYGRGYRSQSTGYGCSGCDICTTLMCCNCMCDLCTGC